MAHSYSHLYNIPTTGLRFFTVYGPWGRPDMALYKFTKSIIASEPIQLYNQGKHRRDFTYIDDIVEGVIRVLDYPAIGNIKWDGKNPDPSTSAAPYSVYNIGNNHPVELMYYVNALEKSLGIVAKKEFLPIQPGDVLDTHADVSEIIRNFDYSPNTSVQTGIDNFISWYKNYYKIKNEFNKI